MRRRVRRGVVVLFYYHMLPVLWVLNGVRDWQDSRSMKPTTQVHTADVEISIS